MKRSKRSHTPEFKAQIAMEALQGRESAADIAVRHGVHVSLVHAWRQQLAASATELFMPSGEVPARVESARARTLQKRIDRLETEQEWLRRVASRLDLHEKRAAMEPANGKLSLLRQTRLLGLHRSGVYYHRRGAGAGHANADANAAVVGAPGVAV